MARTIQEIYDSIIQEKETLSSLSGLLPVGTSYATLLSDLSSASKVAIWRLIAYVVAVSTSTLEKLWDAFKSETTATVQNIRYASLDWFSQKALEFQQGYTLAIDPITRLLGYATIDTSAYIVTASSANEVGRIVNLKLAKGTAPNLEALTSAELASVTSYINRIKVPGQQVQVTSLAADQLQIDLKIKAQAVLTSNETALRASIISAINTYVQGFRTSADVTAFNFDPTFKRLEYEDILQALDGVVGLENNSMIAVQATTQTTITQDYVSLAGYMQLDEANSTITIEYV